VKASQRVGNSGVERAPLPERIRRFHHRLPQRGLLSQQVALQLKHAAAQLAREMQQQ